MIRAKGRPEAPARVVDCEVKSLPMDPVDAFVLSAVDGIASEEDIVAITGLADGDVARRLRKLAEWGAVRLPGEPIAVRPASGAPAPRAAPTPLASPGPSTRVAAVVPGGAPAAHEGATRVVDWYAHDSRPSSAAPPPAQTFPPPASAAPPWDDAAWAPEHDTGATRQIRWDDYAARADTEFAPARPLEPTESEADFFDRAFDPIAPLAEGDRGDVEPPHRAAPDRVVLEPDRSGERRIEDQVEQMRRDWLPPTVPPEAAPEPPKRPRKYVDATRAVQWAEADAFLADLGLDGVADDEEAPPPARRDGGRSRR